MRQYPQYRQCNGMVTIRKQIYIFFAFFTIFTFLFVPECPAQKKQTSPVHIPSVLKKFSSPYFDERHTAIKAINSLTIQQRIRLVPTLLKLVEKGGWHEQTSAAAVLQQIGPKAKSSGPRLKKMLMNSIKKQEWDLACLMVATLKKTDPAILSSCISGIVKNFAVKKNKAEIEKAWEMEMLAVDILKRIGPEAKSAMPDLLAYLGNENRKVHTADILAVFKRIGPGARSSVSVLKNLLVQDDIALRSKAIEVLGAIGHGAEAAVPDLVSLAVNGDQKLVKQIEQTLSRIKKKNNPPDVKILETTCLEGRIIKIKLPFQDRDNVQQVVSIQVVKGPEHGKLIQIGPQAVEYRSDFGFTGTDMFTWKASDGLDESREIKGKITVKPDMVPPVIKSVTAVVNRERVVAEFNKPISAESIRNPKSYSISQGIEIKDVIPSEDNTSVEIRTSPLSENIKYMLTTKNMVDISRAKNKKGEDNKWFTLTMFTPGIICVFYEGVPLGDTLAHFAKLKPKKTGIVKKIYPGIRTRDTQISARFDGYIKISKEGEYVFYTSSDDGTRLYIDSKLIVKNDGMHSTMERSGKCSLKQGMHSITVTFYQGVGPFTLDVSWKGPGIKMQKIPDNVLYYLPSDLEAKSRRNPGKKK